MNPNGRSELTESLRRSPSQAARVRYLLAFMQDHGSSTYDEEVTQLQHAIQAGSLARRSGSDAIVTSAALLHDIGHFLTDETAPDQDFRMKDWQHEELGSRFLDEFFHPLVGEVARRHVDAKRYLCAVDASYHSALSAASVNSLRLQGGPMNETEAHQFEQNPHYEAIAMVRRWDDAAKDASAAMPPIESFEQELLNSLR